MKTTFLPRALPRPSLSRAEAANEIQRATGALALGGLKIDWSRLSKDDARELHRLVSEGNPEGRGFSPGLLDKSDLRRWQRLVEEAADTPGVFEAAREEANLFARMRELAARAARPIPLRREQERGLLAEIDLHLRKGWLWTEHLEVLVPVLAILTASGEPLAPHSSVQRDATGELVLRFHVHYGLLGRSVGERGPRLMPRLEHLQKNKWVTLSRNGTDVQVRLGARAKRALGMTKPKTAKAAQS